MGSRATRGYTRPKELRTADALQSCNWPQMVNGYQMETHTHLHCGQAVHQMAVVIRGHAFSLATMELTTKIPHQPTRQEVHVKQRSP
ncbi:hypothetical protein ACIRQP_41285 [Streptomyces sp. NPDC102274]|uniref:hypothetical protein n=1 Tax=Streptomyces sp. NPDC102274 TaxID=3366151 RepID=UPI0038177461